MANIQMQKTDAGVAYQGDALLSASDLERWTENGNSLLRIKLDKQAS
jgi:hypothetical protein